MKIGLFTYDFDPPIGGLGVHVQRLLEGLKQKPEVEMTVFSPSPYAPRFIASIVRARWNRLGGSPLFSLALTFSLPRYIRRHRLDLIHAHSGSGGVWMLFKPSIPVVVTAHHTYRQEIAFVFGGSCFKRTIKRFIAVLEKRTYRFADIIMCVSVDTLESIVTDYGIDRSKCIVIENSIDIPSPSLAARTENEVLFLGRLERRKGIMTLLDAFEEVIAEQKDAHLTVIGKNLLGSEFVEQAQKKLGDRVSFLGHVSSADRMRHLRTAAVLVTPSLVEGFGLAAAEGLACGICVLASDSPGLRTVVQHEKTGLIFASENSHACADAIIRALKDHNLRSRLMQAGYNDARERFTLEKQVNATLECYKQALK